MSKSQVAPHTPLIIMGAGIGGLTTALTLQQRGIAATIYEGSLELKPVGAGIILANNAMQVFKQLGIHEKIQKAGNQISKMKITEPQLKLISEVDLTRYEEKYGVCNIAIHRGELQAILAQEVGRDNIHLGKRLSKIQKEDFFKLNFEDQSSADCRLLIGADGINSVVRNQLFKAGTLREANQQCWRGICEIQLPSKYDHELNEAWGKGKRFGFVKISEKKFYWYALKNLKLFGSNEPDLTETFFEFHEDIRNMIAFTPKNQIIVSPITDLLPLHQWQRENVCLIGDAAHATTPNLGQGAGQAIEDAYVLGKLLDQGMLLEDTFKKFEALRRKKAHHIVKTSWRVGKIAHLENRFGIWMRNTLMKNMPAAVNQKQMDMIFELS